MTQITTGKHKTPEEIISLYQDRRPGMAITEAMARDTANIEDENTPTPPELIEAINNYNQTLPQEEESDDENTYDKYETLQTPQPQLTKTAISETEKENIIHNFRASYPFRKNVTDDEIINDYLKEQTIKDSNTITAIKGNNQLGLTLNRDLQSNKTNNTITPLQQKDIDEIYQWSCYLSTEQQEDEDYLWTQEATNLYLRLRKTNGNLIAVKALLGCGKTALRQALNKALNKDEIKTIAMKWTGNTQANLTEQINSQGSFQNKFDDDYIYDLIDILYEEAKKINHDIFDCVKYMSNRLGFEETNEWLDQYIRGIYLGKSNYTPTQKEERIIRNNTSNLLPLLEKAIGTKRIKELKDSKLSEACLFQNNIILDLSDYDSQNIGRMTKDIDNLQLWWESKLLENGRNQGCNLVIFFQEELFPGHCWLGKFYVITLSPFTPEEITNHFTKKFPKNPFEKEAIVELASLSQGIMRRFKKYISISLEKYDSVRSKNSSIDFSPITRKNISEWISFDQIVKDMELQLLTVFPKEKEHRILTVKLLRYLREKGSQTQPQIIDDIFDGNKMKASRVLGQLESYRFITRDRDESDKKHLIVQLVQGVR